MPSEPPPAAPAEPPPAAPAALPPEVEPLAWLLGAWEGAGVGGYPTITSFRFGQRIEFTNNGKPFLGYVSRAWLLDDEGNRVRALGTESGYWRPQPDGVLEVTMAHPTGYAEIWVGRVDGHRAEISTDVVARTTSAKDYTAGHRLYGLVGQGTGAELMWTFDMAAMGQPLQSHLSARLRRAE